MSHLAPLLHPTVCVLKRSFLAAQRPGGDPALARGASLSVLMR